MVSGNMTRRRAILVGTSIIIGGSVSGCGVQQVAVIATSAVVKLPWDKIEQVLRATVYVTEAVLRIQAMVEGSKKSCETDLPAEAVAVLQEGGSLIVKGKDGVEHEVPFDLG